MSAVALVTFFSIAFRHYSQGGRLSGIQESILSNPNDLAINIAISFPLGSGVHVASRGFRKVVWGASLAIMCVGVVLTSSRSGLLALIVTIVVCVWEYGDQGKAPPLDSGHDRGFVAWDSASPYRAAHYRARVESIFLGNVEGSGDKGSLEARKELLKKSVMTALTHPVFGVGPGCFPLVDRALEGGSQRLFGNGSRSRIACAGIVSYGNWGVV